MKPSERVEQIRKQMIEDEWVQWAGNRWNHDDWVENCNQRDAYLMRAILAYLDETFKGIH